MCAGWGKTALFSSDLSSLVHTYLHESCIQIPAHTHTHTCIQIHSTHTFTPSHVMYTHTHTHGLVPGKQPLQAVKDKDLVHWLSESKMTWPPEIRNEVCNLNSNFLSPPYFATISNFYWIFYFFTGYSTCFHTPPLWQFACFPQGSHGSFSAASQLVFLEKAAGRCGQRPWFGHEHSWVPGLC